jgi:hypothetical protein
VRSCGDVRMRAQPSTEYTIPEPSNLHQKLASSHMLFTSMLVLTSRLPAS